MAKIGVGIVEINGITAIKYKAFEDGHYLARLQHADTYGDASISDTGTCVIGAGIYCYIIPKGKRKPCKALLIRGPFQGNLAQQAYCAPILGYLAERMPELKAFYFDGFMD